ncbi:MAG: outer membrane protein-like protein, partial [Verrucomicrobiales bacterium]|nr:outer membrane protein-like protein [Verrucomicrobiales bacterium]
NADHLSTASSADTSFIKDAAKGGQMEVKLGQLGADKSSNAEIKSFGERLVKDHTKANEELMKIAQAKGVDLNAAADHSAHDINKFSSKSGADFDKAYIRHMVSDHQKDISKFEKEAAQSTDTELKAFAEKTLPTLREHLRMAQDIARSLGVNTASYSTSADSSAAGAGATISTERDSSNPSINVDTRSGSDKSRGSVDIHTGEPGDGKTLGLNTDKNDGKLLGVVPDPIKKDHSASVDVTTGSTPSASADVNVDTGPHKTLGVTTEKGDGKTLGLNTDKNDGKLLGIIPDPVKKDHAASVNVDTTTDRSAAGNASVNVDTGRSASTTVNTTDRDASVSVDTRPKTKWFSTDKNDGKLWGIFPAPHHKNRGPGVSVDVDKNGIDMNANTGSSAGSAPSSSSGSARSTPNP